MCEYHTFRPSQQTLRHSRAATENFKRHRVRKLQVQHGAMDSLLLKLQRQHDLQILMRDDQISGLGSQETSGSFEELRLGIWDKIELPWTFFSVFEIGAWIGLQSKGKIAKALFQRPQFSVHQLQMSEISTRTQDPRQSCQATSLLNAQHFGM